MTRNVVLTGVTLLVGMLLGSAGTMVGQAPKKLPTMTGLNTTRCLRTTTIGARWGRTTNWGR